MSFLRTSSASGALPLFRLSALATLALLACASHSAGYAQTQDIAGRAAAPATLGEVVVSGSRNEQLSDDLPLSIDVFDAKTLRDTVDRLKQQLGDAAIVLASVNGGKASLVAGVNGSACARVKAGDLVAFVANRIGGKGGGRADMAQGGGDDGPQLLAALQAVPDWVGRQSTEGSP